ncbi:hypothetical protein [Pseudomonas oryzihabitans]|uniref:hypothetical protein n=1 Tax=Pseudomonas oryzihabitans TaxID=47885 RepID=UPI0028ABC137|nr:hypothetical protein [Pseudomonas oryzihabitans]
MLADLSVAARAVIVALVLVVVAAAAYKVADLAVSNHYLTQVADQQTQLTRLALDKGTLTGQVGDLKLAVAQQTAAAELAEEKTRSAEAQQAQAKEQAGSQAKQTQVRITALERALANAQSTLHDMMRQNWETQP